MQREPLELPRELVEDAKAHARECRPEECCGLMLGRAGEPPLRGIRCTNVQSRRQSMGESALDARHAFWIDERELLAAQRSADERGEELRVIYHSHVEAAAYLSATDVEGALGPLGLPLYPNAVYLVISVAENDPPKLAAFEWDPELREFVGRGVREVG